LKSGSYTIVPARSGYTFTPVSQAVAISSGNVAGMGFSVAQNQTTSSITPDVGVWRDQSSAKSTISSPAFSTLFANELLLAFIATDYSGSTTTVRSVSGPGLTWVLVVRANSQRGTSEIWRAFAATPQSNVSVTANLSQKVSASMTVMSFTGVDTTGTNGAGAIGAIANSSARSAAPAVTLATTRNNSWVFAVGNDTDKAFARTPGAGQTIVHQYLAFVGATYWVQSQSAATPLSGSAVTINDTAPTSDRYNLSAVEILPALVTATSAPLLGKAVDKEVSSAANTLFAPTLQNAERAQAPTFTLANIATGEGGDVCSPGGLASILGSIPSVQGLEKVNSFPLPTSLAGVQVRVNAVAAPLLFASNSQVNFQCPVLTAGTPLSVTVEDASGMISTPVLSEMRPAAPGLFTISGTKKGVILIANTNEIAMEASQTIPSRPAMAGESLTIYASGLGESAEDVIPGEAAPLTQLVVLKNKVTVVLGGSEIVPDFAGLAPGAAGLYQVNLHLPGNVSTGDSLPLYLKVTLADGTVLQSNSVEIALHASSLPL
jgi:uncharacterized protein (TIGR03437 family)